MGLCSKRGILSGWNWTIKGRALKRVEAHTRSWSLTTLGAWQRYVYSVGDHVREVVQLKRTLVRDDRRGPAHMLGVGSASHAVQTARVMERIEPVLEEERPDLVIVPGDVNSTLAATLVAVKLGIPVAHLESGLRSFDRTMGEEINRIVAGDAMACLFDKPLWRRSPHPRHPNVPPRCPTPGGARSRACRGTFERGSGSASRRATRPRGDGIPPAEMLRETARCQCPSRAA